MLSKDDVIRIAKESGFIAAGIAPARLNDSYYRNLVKWLDLGYHGDMQWMRNHQDSRADISRRFPWVKSVLVVADNYYCEKSPDGQFPKVSRYAWGIDYHIIVHNKLKDVLGSLKAMDSKTVGKIYVDTGAMLEKGYAVSAGLGWQGKNTNLIVNGHGSFSFLGILLLNIELEYSIPTEDLCGNCRRCIDACPTGALVEPYIIDSRKCISYLTIEKRSEHDEKEKSMLNGWLYGCDICQNVCPYNMKWSRNAEETRYFKNLKLLEKSPNEWIDLSEEVFKDQFRESPIKRVKLEGVRRNILSLL